MDSIELLRYKDERVSINVDARLDDDGSLTISGQDLGAATEEFWGSSDYEYWYALDKDNTDRLSKTFSDSRSLCENLKSKFGDNTSWETNFKEYCKLYDISYKFNSWSE